MLLAIYFAVRGCSLLFGLIAGFLLLAWLIFKLVWLCSRVLRFILGVWLDQFISYVIDYLNELFLIEANFIIRYKSKVWLWGPICAMANRRWRSSRKTDMHQEKWGGIVKAMFVLNFAEELIAGSGESIGVGNASLFSFPTDMQILHWECFAQSHTRAALFTIRSSQDLAVVFFLLALADDFPLALWCIYGVVR